MYDLRIIFLGTSASRPTINRNLSCVCIEIDDTILMFDAGENAQVSYAKSGLKWNKKMKLFITHLHGDHCIGILGLLQTMSIQQRTKPIEIYGPEGIIEFIVENMKTLNFNLTYPVLINSINEKTVIQENMYKINCCKARHSIRTFSFLLEKVFKYGKFSPSRAMQFNVPKGNMWKELQNGNNVKIGNKMVNASDIVKMKKDSRRIGISGDTRPTKKLERFFNNCDYLIFDSTFLHNMKYKAIKTQHTTAYEAALLANHANVKKLILTHFSTRYKNENKFVEEAKKVHHKVICAADFKVVDVE